MRLPLRLLRALELAKVLECVELAPTFLRPVHNKVVF